MNARSALFDLYGDHLRARGGAAPVAALVRLLAPLDVAAPAVRTAVSRMVRQGWLAPVRVDGGPGYALTARGQRRLDDAAARIYRAARARWDGRWHLLVVDRPESRAARARLRDGLAFLGYAPLDDTTWIAPRPSVELDELLAGEGVRAERFCADLDGDGLGLVRRAWDLEGLGRAYARWLDEAAAVVATAPAGCDDETAFAARSRLVHGWRKFLFTDPGLPPSLLPPGWPGERAAEFFDREAARLLPAAARFVTACLAAAGSADATAPAPRTAVPPIPDQLADPTRGTA